MRAGDLLLTFDLDRWRAAATSLMTPVIITNGERFRIRDASLNRAVAVGDPLFELEEFASGGGVRAPSPARRWSANRWWSRMRTASMRGPRH